MLDFRFSQVQASLVAAEEAYSRGDVALAACYMHQAARWAVNLSDEIRYEHGVKAGRNQVKIEQAERAKRKKKAPPFH